MAASKRNNIYIEGFVKNVLSFVVNMRPIVMLFLFDPRRLLKWLFFRPLHAPLISAADLKKSDYVMTNISRPQFAAQLLEIPKKFQV